MLLSMAYNTSDVAVLLKAGQMTCEVVIRSLGAFSTAVNTVKAAIHGRAMRPLRLVAYKA